jgi:hypothetical protein
LKYQKLSFGYFIITLSVQANTLIVTTVSWENRNIVIANVKYSWLFWSNIIDDIPAETVALYYNESCISRINHKWKVNQTVNLKINYLIIGNN